MARRILLLITDLEIGGTPTVVRELAVRLNNPPNVHVEVACLAPWGPVADQLRAAQVEVTALGARSARDVRAIWKLIKLIHEHRIDTVFSFLIHANVAATIARLFVREVRFFQSIQTTQPTPKWHWKLQAIVQHAAEKIAVPSQSVAQVAQEWSGLLPKKIVVIPNAVNLEAYHEPLVRPAQHRADARVRVGFIGRLDPIKRVADLIDAMALLDSRFECHIYGDGPQRQTLETHASRPELGTRIFFHGTIAEPTAALNAIDILVLPSEAEGFGLVLIEAMAAGVPVIATNVPGIRDVVRDGKNGLLVPAKDPARLADAIRQIADNPQLPARLVKAAYHDVQQKFTWAQVLPQYRQILGLPMV